MKNSKTSSSLIFDHMFRYIVVGDMAVGKSCIVLQFTDNKFRYEHQLTIGVEFGGKTIEVNNKIIKIQIWDTTGQEAFQSITKTYFKGAVGALLVYDITRRDSFEHITKWLNDVRINGSKDICCILIGNKKDLENSREVSFDEGKELAEKNGLLFLETSALTSENIQEAFIISAEQILDNINKSGIDPTSPSKNVKISVDDDEEDNNGRNKKKCC